MCSLKGTSCCLGPLPTLPGDVTPGRDVDWSGPPALSFLPAFAPRAFKINELKAEVANHLAMLEKREEKEGRREEREGGAGRERREGRNGGSE